MQKYYNTKNRGADFMFYIMMALFMAIGNITSTITADKYINKVQGIEDTHVYVSIVIREIARQIRAGIIFDVDPIEAFYRTSMILFNTDRDNIAVALYSNKDGNITILPPIMKDSIDVKYSNRIFEQSTSLIGSTRLFAEFSQSTIASIKVNDEYSLYAITHIDSSANLNYINIFFTFILIFIITFAVMINITYGYSRYLSIIYKAFLSKKRIFSRIQDPYCEVINKIKRIDANLEDEIASSKQRLEAISNDEGGDNKL